MARVLITGANRGIGLELARIFHNRGDEVLAVCRTASDELRALGARLIEGVDLTDPDLGGIVDKVDGHIDVLFNNAGVLLFESLTEMDPAGIRQQFEINALGPLRLSAALLPNLGEGSKVIMMTSRMGSIGDNTSGGMYGYRMSKAALNMAGVCLAHDLRRHKIAVAILHPGFVRTEMTRGSGNTEPADAAASLIQRVDALTLESSGTFWHAEGEVLPW